MAARRVVAAPDMHLPYGNTAGIAACLAFIRRFKPHMVIQMGDILDLKACSRYSKSGHDEGAAAEIRRGQAQAREFWDRVRDAAPKADRVQLSSNHGERIRKRLQEAAPAAELLTPLSRFDTFEGVTNVANDRDPFAYDGTVYVHGFKKFGDHARYFLAPTVVGHLHIGGVVHVGVYQLQIWELVTGNLLDERNAAFNYVPSAVSRWQTGWGAIDDDGPRFIPFGGAK